MVEARGVEPLSEIISTRASTGVATALAFPRHNAQWQALCLGSFINPVLPQSFGRMVPAFNLPALKA